MVCSAGLLKEIATSRILETPITFILHEPFLNLHSILFSTSVFLCFTNGVKLHLPFLSALFFLSHYNDWAHGIQTHVSLHFSFQIPNFYFIFCDALNTH